MMDWAFKSSQEQRMACRDRWKFPLPTQEEAERAAADFNHYWRGTKTIHRVIPVAGGYSLEQDIA